MGLVKAAYAPRGKTPHSLGLRGVELITHMSHCQEYIAPHNDLPGLGLQALGITDGELDFARQGRLSGRRIFKRHPRCPHPGLG
jgi:hypothetical protein